jgi:20S proteasome alpha/beta subunit
LIPSSELYLVRHLKLFADYLTLFVTHSIEEKTAEDGHSLGPTEIYEYLSQLMYARRSKMNPLWNALVLAGRKKGEK